MRYYAHHCAEAMYPERSPFCEDDPHPPAPDVRNITFQDIDVVGLELAPLFRLEFGKNQRNLTAHS